MGEESARLRAEIEQTRENLTRDVDLLAEKTSPSKIVERRVNRTKRGIAGLKDKVMGALPGSDDDDEQQYRGGYGYGTSYSGGHGSDGPGLVDNARSAVSGGVDTARSAVAGGVSQATDTLSSVRDSVTGTVSNATSSATDTLSNVREQAGGNPLAVGAVAFGVGWIVSSLLPASAAERRATQRAVEQVKSAPVLDQAKSAAQEVGQNLQQSATQAVQQVKEKAQEATSTVKEEAQGAAQDVKQSAGGAAQDVKQSATGAAQDVKDQTQQHVEAVRSGSTPSGGSSTGSTGSSSGGYGSGI